jgi:GntR family transcriptional regulator
MLDRDSPQPLSRQLATLIGDQIRSGERAPRSRLPSITQLASEHEVATATVVKALRILKDEGLVAGTAGHGTFVAVAQADGEEPRDSFEQVILQASLTPAERANAIQAWRDMSEKLAAYGLTPPVQPLRVRRRRRGG